jgi:DNA repair protein RadC
MTIKKLPVSERPYEKIEMYGAEKLSNSELLAIIIKTGTKDKTSVELAQQILGMKSNSIENNNMRFLQDMSIEEFMQIKGIGKVKAIQLKAICELTKRMARPIEKIQIKLKSSQDVANLLMDELKFEKREIVKELILNTKNTLLKIIDISFGGTDSAIVEPKDILQEPIKMGAPKIILVHNHPSGDPRPSKQDIDITKRILEAANLLGIILVDHIVIGDEKYETVLPYIKN